MDKNLELLFKNTAGKNARISVQDPKEDLTTEEVQALMDNILDKNVFETPGGDLLKRWSPSHPERSHTTYRLNEISFRGGFNPSKC